MSRSIEQFLAGHGPRDLVIFYEDAQRVAEAILEGGLDTVDQRFRDLSQIPDTNATKLRLTAIALALCELVPDKTALIHAALSLLSTVVPVSDTAGRSVRLLMAAICYYDFGNQVYEKQPSKNVRDLIGGIWDLTGTV